MEQMTYEQLLAERDLLRKRILELEKENALLRERLGENNTINISQSSIQKLSVQQKIELFRSLFKGREDVFARRWYSTATGKAGYQPVCINEWNTQLCNKKKQKCSECPNRKFSFLSYDDYYKHLSGKDEYGRDVIGIYPILKDNTCYFLCVDFDDKNCEKDYKRDVLAFVNVCEDWKIPFSIERSRSGNGAHVWIFLETPIVAVKVRRLGNAIMTEAMNKDGRISFKSYDRFFPNQDYLTEDGLGNLIALPLQGKARKNNNSVFVNKNFEAYPNQWDYLLNVEKLSENTLDELIGKNTNIQSMGDFSKTSESKPWETPTSYEITKADFRNELSIIRANMLYITLNALSSKVLNHLKRIASFKNPEFYTKQAMRLSTYSIPRIISCAEISEEYIALPRGCEEVIDDFFKQNNVSYQWIDKTNKGSTISISFKGKLYEQQTKALQTLSSARNGVLCATTAFGKTVTAIGLIAEKKVNTLILVHTKALLNQWKEELEKFLDIEYNVDENTSKRTTRKKTSPIGTLSSNGNKLKGIIDVAIIQSCIADKEVKPFVKNYGMVVVDECHHVSAVSFEQVLKNVNACYVYGLTSTPIRKDGLQPIIFMQCGQIRYTSDAKQQIQLQNFQRLLIPRFTQSKILNKEQTTYTQIIRQLVMDEDRNILIAEDVRTALSENRSSIILTSLTNHVTILANLLKPYCKNVVTLVGSESAKDKKFKQELLQNVPSNEPLVIAATGKYIGEGFDCPRLDTLFMALPVSWKGIVVQYAGRLHRNYKGKKEVRIYDYVDNCIPMCNVMYQRRLKGYENIGYTFKTKEPKLF